MRPEFAVYYDAAERESGAEGPAQLARALGLTDKSTVTKWRTKGVLPKPETMVRLCELAKMDVEKGLIDLAQWQAEMVGQSRAAGFYASASARLAGAALVLLLIGAPTLLASAGERSGNNLTSSVRPLYIMEN